MHAEWVKAIEQQMIDISGNLANDTKREREREREDERAEMQMRGNQKLCLSF
jgi:hypothetical protein